MQFFLKSEKTNPGMGIIRHADADYYEAIEFAQRNDVKIPMI